MSYDNQAPVSAASSGLKKSIIIGSIVLVVVGIVVAGILIVRQRAFRADVQPQAPGIATPQDSAPGESLGGNAVVTPAQDQGTPQNGTLPPEESLPGIFDEEAFSDQDGDGITDDEERELETNPARADTDGDGLSDGDEVRVYCTDPNNQRTNDGLNDGDWVQQQIENSQGQRFQFCVN